MSFDAQKYIQERNEREALERRGEKPAAAAAVAEAPKAEEPKGDDKEPEGRHEIQIPRSVRRKLNELLRENGELAGELKALKERFEASAAGSKKADHPPAPDANAKPERKDFASDADFAAASGVWAARQESASAKQLADFEKRLKSMSAKAEEDIALIPDFEDHIREAEENGPKVDLAKDHPTLVMLIGLSEYSAFVLDHFATHPDEYEEMLALTKTPEKQIEEFHRLEGYLKRVYIEAKKKAAQAGKSGESVQSTDKSEKSKDRNEADGSHSASQSGSPAQGKTEPAKTKLPPPSEAGAPRGGSAPVSDLSPFLADGKTVNPAWKERRNQRALARR